MWLNKTTNFFLRVIMRKLIQGWFLHACFKNTNCFVVSKNTDFFVLMVFTFASCSMKIDHGKYINSEKVVKYLGHDLT